MSSFPTLAYGTSFFDPVSKRELHRSREGEYYVSNKSGEYYYFTREVDKNGWHQLRLLCDRNGFSIRFDYRNHLLTGATDSAGRQIRFMNDANGRIVEVQAPQAGDRYAMQTKVRYVYDERGRMTSATDSTGVEQTFSWHDTNDRIASRRFKGGHVFRFGYDKQNRCIAAEGPEGMFSYYFRYENSLTVVTDSVGAKRYYYTKVKMVFGFHVNAVSKV